MQIRRGFLKKREDRKAGGDSILKDVQITALLVFVLTAVLSDLRTGRIPNGLIVTGLSCGLAYQLLLRGAVGVIFFLGGCLLPVLVMGGLYLLRMIGAGDIKLLSAAGGFMGPAACFSCVVSSVLFGGLIALALMVRRRNVIQRLFCFYEYASECSRTGRWRPYLPEAGAEARFCFSVPVLLAVLSYIGGAY